MFSFNSFLIFASPVLILGAVVVLRRIGRERVRMVIVCAFAVYALKVLDVTLFPVPIDPEMAHHFREVGFLDVANLVPLVRLIRDGLAVQDLLNILLGVPFGLGIFFVARRMTPLRALGFGVGASIIIEILQAILGAVTGIPFRTLDVDDVLLNGFGVLVGICGFVAVRMIYRRFVPAEEEPADLLGGYLHRAFWNSPPDACATFRPQSSSS